jgi:hypothetical protein
MTDLNQDMLVKMEYGAPMELEVLAIFLGGRDKASAQDETLQLVARNQERSTL